MILRAVAVVAFALVACNTTPDPAAPAAPAASAAPSASGSASPAQNSAGVELNSACKADADCAPVPGATCMKGGLGPTKGGLCRLLCNGAKDPRCTAPNACLSAGMINGVEGFSCERTCVGDTDCRGANRSCQHVMGPSQPGFCVESMGGKSL